MTDEFHHRRMISWGEVASLSKIRGLTNIQSQWLPKIGYFVTLEGTEKAVREAKARLVKGRG